MNIGVYPGTFDPVTFGHLDLIMRAKKIVETLHVAVAENTSKKTLFTLDERLDMLRIAIGKTAGIIVETFQGLTVDYCRSIKACAIIRGLRALTDFEYEFQMALTNRRLDENVETVFMMPSEQYTYISSSMIKEIARLDGDISAFVPKKLIKCIKEKCRNAGKNK